jgi:protein-S-isoprenylcysteine O-methyltransferase Ste14
VAVSLSLYTWYLVNHFRTYRVSVRVNFTPPHLVVTEPYVIPRNPMYVPGLLIWFGWTVYFGIPTILMALILIWEISLFE